MKNKIAKISLSTLLLIVMLFLMISLFTASADTPLKEVDGVWNFENDKQEWYIQNCSIVGWCPRDNCTSIDDSWYSGKMSFKFQHLNGTNIDFNLWEISDWTITNSTTPLMNGTGDVPQLNCSATLYPFEEPVELKILYRMWNHSIRIGYPYILDTGNLTYQKIKYTWELYDHNLNNTVENDYLYINKTDRYPLESNETKTTTKTKYDLSTEGDFYDIILKEEGEEDNLLIGSQLFWLKYWINETIQREMENVQLIVTEKPGKTTKVQFIADFGEVGANSILWYDYQAGGDAISGGLLIGTSQSATAADQTYQDKIVRSKDGRDHFAFTRNQIIIATPHSYVAYCNTSDSKGNSVSCEDLVDVADAAGLTFDEATMAIDSDENLIIFFENNSVISYITSTDLFDTWSSVVDLPESETVYNPSVFVDKNDGIHLVAVNKTDNNCESYYWYSQSISEMGGISRTTLGATNSGTGPCSCDGEVGPNEVIDIICGIDANTVESFSFPVGAPDSPTKTTVDSSGAGQEMEVSIDYNENVWVSGYSGDDHKMYNATIGDDYQTWQESTYDWSSTVQGVTTIRSWDDILWRVIEFDENTDDYVLYGSYSNDSGTEWSYNFTLQDDGASESDNNAHHNVRGSSYPVFNRFSFRMDYIFENDVATPYSIYYSNYTLDPPYSDKYGPEGRSYNDNATNGTQDTGDTFWAFIECFDDSNISNIIFAVKNGTDDWANHSKTNYSSTTYYQTKNETYTISAGDSQKVQWKYYCNDTSGNWYEGTTYELWTDVAPASPEPPSEGLLVWRSGWPFRGIKYAIFNGSDMEEEQIYEDVLDGGTILDINLEECPTRNETAVRIVSNDYNDGGFVVALWNKTDWFQKDKFTRYTSYGWPIGDIGYRANGDLIAARAAGYDSTTSYYSKNETIAISVWDGVEWVNTTYNAPNTIDIDAVDIDCSPFSDYCILQYGEYVGSTYWKLYVGILDTNNSVINETYLGHVHAYDSISNSQNRRSWDATFMMNGTGVLCYGNHSAPTYNKVKCMFWSAEEKAWGEPKTLHTGTTNDESRQGYVVPSYTDDNKFMTWFKYRSLWYFHWNGTTFSKNESLSNSEGYSYHLGPLFSFINSSSANVDINGIHHRVYRDSYRRSRYWEWDNTIESFGDFTQVNQHTYHYHISVYGDRYSGYSIFTNIDSNQRLKVYLYNVSSEDETGLEEFTQAPMSHYLRYEDFVFYEKLTVSDTKEPYWTDNQTPTGTLKVRTDTTLEVKLNDDFPSDGTYIFSTNNTGTWINSSIFTWSPNEVVQNVTYINQTKGKEICFKWHFNDSIGNINVTDDWCFIVNNTLPTINPYTPQNVDPRVSEGSDRNFTVTPTDADGDSVEVYWLVNSTFNKTGNNLTVNWTTGKEGQDFNITVVASDDEDNTTFEWTLHIETPTCDNPGTNQPPSPATYKYNQTHDWTSYCTAGTGTIDEVTLQFYDLYNITYDELTRSGSSYTWYATNMSGGTYTMCWQVNDTDGNNNWERCQDDKWLFIINKRNVTVNFTLNVSSPQFYPDGLYLDCNTSFIGAQVSLYQNGTLLKTGTRADVGEISKVNYTFKGNLSAGYYNFTCETEVDHVNYSHSTNQSLFDYKRSISGCNISFEANPVTLPNKIYAIGWSNNSEANWSMYRELTPGGEDYTNRTNETNTNATVNQSGAYHYIVNVTETANWTSCETEEFLTMLPQPGEPWVSLFKPTNESVIDTTWVWLNWTSDDPEEGMLNTTIFINESIANLDSSNKTTYENVNATDDGNESYNFSGLISGNTYYWKIVVNDSQGLSDVSEIWQFTVTSGLDDNVSCTSDGDCTSGYCDDDGAGRADDYLCYTPYNTYFHNEPAATGGLDTCELDIGPSIHWATDELEVGNGTGLCDEVGETYFEDNVTSTCGVLDEGASICRSASFNSTCTADASCEGVVAGTSFCTSACEYSDITFTNPINGSINFRRYENFTANITITSSGLNLNYSWIGHNATGSWANATIIALSGTSYNPNSTINITVANGSQVCWRYYANDSNNNLNESGQHCFTVDDTPPRFNETIPDQVAVTPFGSILFDVNCTDVDGTDVTFADDTALFDINANTGIISDTPTESENGTYEITITCENGLQRNRTFDYMIGDNVSPIWSDNGTNNTSPKYNDSVNFYVNWSDGVGLSTHIFSTNTTGTWVNDSVVSFDSNYIEDASFYSVIGWTNPLNANDSDWDTFSTIASDGDFVYTEYHPTTTNPIVLWQVKDTISTRNITVPDKCYKSSVNQYTLRVLAVGTSKLRYQCFNNSNNWDNLTGEYASDKFYEEAISWDVDWNVTVNKTISQTKGNIVCWRMYVNDTFDNKNETDEFCLTVGNSAPSFNNSLTDQSVVTPNSLNYDVNCTDVDGDTITYSDNSTLVDTNSATGLITDTPIESENGTYTINITCSDGSDSKSETFNYYIGDGTPPQWSSNQTSIVSTYSPTTKSYFNITCTDNGGGVDDVILETNHSGINNYTMNLLGSNIYNYSEIYPAGDYYWKVYCNDTFDNKNLTTMWNFSIGKANGIVNLTLNGDEDNLSVTYPNTITAIYWSNDPPSEMFRNGTNINTENNTAKTLAVSSYNYTVNSSENQNYSPSIKTFFVTVTSGTVNLNLTFNGTEGNLSVLSGSDVNITGNISVEGKRVLLYNNSILMHNGTDRISNITKYFNEESAINISVIFDGDENYSSNIKTFYITVTLDNPPTWSGNGTNDSQVLQKDNVSVYVLWSDETALSFAIFAHNQSGALTNVSNQTLSGTSQNTSFTINVTLESGNTICWRQYANDSTNQWNETDLFCFDVTTVAAPSTGGGGGGGGITPFKFLKDVEVEEYGRNSYQFKAYIDEIREDDSVILYYSINNDALFHENMELDIDVYKAILADLDKGDIINFYVEGRRDYKLIQSPDGQLIWNLPLVQLGTLNISALDMLILLFMVIFITLFSLVFYKEKKKKKNQKA